MSPKFGNIIRWVYGHLTGKTTNFKWILKDKLAGSAIPTSSREIRWLQDELGIKSIVTIKEKPLPNNWLYGDEKRRIEYYHLSVEDKQAPSLAELDNAVNYIRNQINDGKPVMVHCSGGKGRTGTILTGYLLKVENDLTAEQAISKITSLRGKSIESEQQKLLIFKYEKYLKKMRDESE